MSEELVPAALARRVADLYLAAGFFAVLGIVLLAGYSVQLGPLVGPGVESSFGLAVALMFLLGALVVHLADRTYREWPLGRKFVPPAPGPVTNQSVATFLKVVVVAATVGGLAWIFWSLLGG